MILSCSPNSSEHQLTLISISPLRPTFYVPDSSSSSSFSALILKQNAQKQSIICFDVAKVPVHGTCASSSVTATLLYRLQTRRSHFKIL